MQSIIGKRTLAIFVGIYLTTYYIEMNGLSQILYGTFTALLFAAILWLAQRKSKVAPENLRHSIRCRFEPIFILGGLFLAIFSGHSLRLRAVHQCRENSLAMPTELVQIYYGRVIRDSVPDAEDNFRFTLQLFATSDGRHLLSSARGRVHVRAARSNPSPGLGQLLAVRAPIKEFSPEPQSPAILFSRAGAGSVEAFQPGDFARLVTLPSGRAEELLASRQIAYALYSGEHLGWLRQFALRLGLQATSWSAFEQKLWLRRSILRRCLFDNLHKLFPIAGRDLFLALLFGISEELPETVKENFRLSGCMHILALSGLHVGILASIVSFLLRPLFGLRRSLLCSSLILTGYLWLVGPLPSLTRSVLMFLLLNAAKFWLRRGDSLLILAVSALLQTQIFPTAALSLSFQLSYAALLGLILFAGRFNTLALLLHYRMGLFTSHLGKHWEQSFDQIFHLGCLPRKILRACLGGISRISRYVLQGIGITLAVLLCSAPILIVNFGQIQWIGIFASLVETPIITVYMCLSLLLWAMAYLLDCLNWEGLWLQLHSFYPWLYHISLAPMKFFAQARPWQLVRPDGNCLAGPIALYLILSFSLLITLYRYELRRSLPTLRPQMIRVTRVVVNAGKLQAANRSHGKNSEN